MGGGAGTHFMRSRITIDPRLPTMPGQSTSGFHSRGGRHRVNRARAKRREVFGEAHEGWASFCSEPCGGAPRTLREEGGVIWRLAPLSAQIPLKNKKRLMLED